MSSFDLSLKFKGLINGKVWKSGSLKLYNNGLAAIYREETHFYVFKESLSRFTGFVNTDGEEIYDGDILALEEKDEISIVFWDELRQQWMISTSPFEDPLLNRGLQNCLDQRVIGHIFTHEYLLNSPKGVIWSKIVGDINRKIS